VTRQDRTLSGVALKKIETLLQGSAGQGRVRRVWPTVEPWTVESGLITPAVKLKYPRLDARFAQKIVKPYVGRVLCGAS
jgi:long-chain acyl-CoA synthetase